eukprot:gnl/TRDRNA2_/TRDRNA2_204167_c0_seq1.p1 gnl/TRDRNA2_/TRDRNA2_204167_c0~~gnl/TRDRNA2_/TRDRNA2_204167_c0_seq1.p1  ORF type:complete len:353 (+),score=41.28 gnl/TRDRNA2_/TRDRNA2_204167_c0_seq1:100-1158(+)
MRRLSVVQRTVNPSTCLGGDEWPSAAPRPAYHRPHRLEAGTPDVQFHLAEHGFAVVKEVLTEAECRKAVDLTWDFIEAATEGSVSRSDITTWKDDTWPVRGDVFLLENGANHCAAAWFVRGIPKVKDIFASLWGTADLLVSFDAVCVHRPWAHPLGSKAWRARTGFYHADQSSMHRKRFVEPAPVPDSEREYVQGCVNLIAMNEHTGGHAVVPGSHKCYSQMMAKHAVLERGFPIPATEPMLGTAVIPHLEAGDMLLFDSRVLQCHAPGLRPSPTSKAAMLHEEIYVTMSPKALASAETLAQRTLSFDQASPLGSHAAHHRLASALGPPKARPGRRVIMPPPLTADQQELVA